MNKNGNNITSPQIDFFEERNLFICYWHVYSQVHVPIILLKPGNVRKPALRERNREPATGLKCYLEQYLLHTSRKCRKFYIRL